MSLRKNKQNLLRFVGNYSLPFAVTALCRSLKIIKVNEEAIIKLNEQKQNYVLAFWHSTMLLPWYLHGGQNFAALTSKSKDGDLLAKILKRWKYEVVRGSSSSGGDVALGIMIDYAKNNYSIAITPDGPRGPIYKFKAGGVITAKKANLQLVLAGVGFRKKRELSNWDRFEIPHFFSSANIHYSDPVYIDKNLNYEQTNEMIKKCEEILNELQNNAKEFN